MGRRKGLARRRGEVTEDLTFFSPRLNPQGEELNPAVGGKSSGIFVYNSSILRVRK